jgi:hypothetical protein
MSVIYVDDVDRWAESYEYGWAANHGCCGWPTSNAPLWHGIASSICHMHQENPLGYIVSYRQMPKYR